MTSSTFKPGKALLTLQSVFTIIGPYIADWNETHVLNPTWPPHARFHNGQTMSLGAFLGASMLYYLYLAPSPPSSTTSASTSPRLTHLNFVLLLLHAYYLPAMSGILYPGAAWMDPEFGTGSPQLKLFPAMLVAGWCGWYVERRRVLSEALTATDQERKGL